MICANRPQHATAIAGIGPDHALATLNALPRLVRLGMLAVALCGTTAANPDGDAVFAEPTSGKPVNRYTVELAVSGEQRRRFKIPEECAEVERLLEHRRADTTRIVDRRLWGKVSEDCWFHAFLNRHPFRGITDFVTDYDFKNAQLADLPIDLDCVGDATDGLAVGCSPAATDQHGLLRHFPSSRSELDTHDHATSGECLLRDGVFYGEMYVGTDGVHCHSGNSQPTLRLIAVDYADIDGDGFLDAVLRFVPLGRGASRALLILPLTRKSAHGPFQALDHGHFGRE